ncbi:MAG: HAD hydrolase-like protein [Bacteroidales bacterium]|jgi:3-deoxy-D-manno-octulosonate 8-phosphate phosphatase (KDO 8-P phosphatase)|nr:HAD hydrolase-like protein [Bacteroidales bacterium]
MNYKAKLNNIKAFVLDYDGVLSDGNIWVADANIVMRSGNVKDGYAMQYAIKKGYDLAVISGGNGQSIAARMEMLGIKDVFLGSHRKKEIFLNYLQSKNLKAEEVLYMGDDIPDYDVMIEAGVATCPADAAIEIKQVADYISHLQGGQGCVRDVIEQVLRLQGRWFHEDGKAW